MNKKVYVQAIWMSRRQQSDVQSNRSHELSRRVIAITRIMLSQRPKRRSFQRKKDTRFPIQGHEITYKLKMMVKRWTAGTALHHYRKKCAISIFLFHFQIAKEGQDGVIFFVAYSRSGGPGVEGRDLGTFKQ